MKDSLSEPTSETLQQKPAEALEAGVREWPTRIKDWFEKLRKNIAVDPGAVLEEAAQAQGNEMGLVDVRSAQQSLGDPEDKMGQLDNDIGDRPIILEDRDHLSVESNKTGRVGETVCFGYRQQILRIPEARVSPDANFPSAHTGLQPDTMKGFAIQVVDSTQPSNPTDDCMIATDKSGRQLFTEPTYSIIFEGRHLTTVLVKSTGMSQVARNKWRSYRGQQEPFFYCVHEDDTWANTQTGITGSDGFLGLSVKEDQRLDAEKSLQLHKAGVKARIPLSGWQVKELRVGGVWRDAEWFRAQGYQGDELFQSAWGMTCPLRLQDVNDFLTQAISKDRDPSKLDPLLQELFQLAKKDQSQPYQELATKWGAVNGAITNEQRVAMWTDFGIALSKTMGQNFEALSSSGLSHGNIHDQNITFFGEICDNSEVKSGRLVAGASQKKGDDVMSFAGRDELSGIKKFAFQILVMAGQRDYSEVEVNKALVEIYFPAVRQEWKSYEEWVKNNIRQLTSEQGRRQEIRSHLIGIYGESEVSEDRITDEILRRTGGEKRFRAYG